jgi:hypothetical protein
MNHNLARRLANLERTYDREELPLIFVLRASQDNDDLVALGDFVRQLGETVEAFKARVSAQHRLGSRVLIASYKSFI